MKIRSLCRLFLLVLTIMLWGPLTSIVFCSVDPVDEGWAWSAVVLPPDGGWESEIGRSMRAALEFAEMEVNDSPYGIRDHDVYFTYEDPLSPEKLKTRVEKWRRRGVLALVSLASEEVNGRLLDLLGRRGPALILAGGSSFSLLYGKGRPLPYAFSLSLDGSFSSRAFVEYAARRMPSGTRIAIFSDLLTDCLSRKAQALKNGLQVKGFDPSLFWMAGEGDRAFEMMTQEAVSSGAAVFTSWLDLMATRALYLRLSRGKNGMALWYGGAVSRGMLSMEGLLVSDQSYPLKHDPSTARLKARIWDDLHVRVPDASSAAVAYAACQWLFSALRSVDEVNVPSVAVHLASTSGIPLGGEVLRIDPASHRPESRRVAILRVEQGTLKRELLFDLSAKGPGDL